MTKKGMGNNLFFCSTKQISLGIGYLSTSHSGPDGTGMGLERFWPGFRQCQITATLDRMD